MRRRGYQRVQGQSLMNMLKRAREALSCDRCAGRGFQLDWTDQGGAMRAVPGDTCRHCSGTGVTPTKDKGETGK